MQHRLEMHQTAPQVFAAACSCGWVGEDQISREIAGMQGSKHKLAACRAETKALEKQQPK